MKIGGKKCNVVIVFHKCVFMFQSNQLKMLEFNIGCVEFINMSI